MIGHKWLADASVLTCGLQQPYFLSFVTSSSCSFPTVAYVGLCGTQLIQQMEEITGHVRELSGIEFGTKGPILEAPIKQKG